MNAEEVRAELERILAFGDIQSSRQASRFLSFVVEETLAGRHAQLKERTIAIGALDRDDEFDPRIDPIVRVVAGKLRRILDRFNLSVGASDDVRIDISKGSYVPRFTSRSESTPDESTANKARPSDSILRTKLHAPAVSPDLVRQTATLERLTRHRHLPLTIVSAPAGYGKSTLLSAWLEESDVPSAWLSLDEDDNDLREFVGGLVAAVQTVFPAAAEATRTLLTAPDLPPVRQLSRQLLNDLNELDDPFVLVLDDYHVIHEQAVHDLLAELLRHPPQPMHLAVLTREDLPLALERVRGRGQILDLSMFDLRFTPAETAEFLGKVLHVALSDTVARAVAERMEGWPAGLRLLAQSLRHEEDPERAIGALQGDLQSVADYLISEVLSQLPPVTAASLLKLPILDRFDDSLCEKLCAEDPEAARHERGARSLITWLQDHNLFLISLDNEQRWFRFHHLFQSLLKETLERQYGDEEIAALHASASAWFEAEGLIDEAIKHSLNAGHIERAAQIVERNARAKRDQGQWFVVTKWLSQLPDSIVQERPELLLGQAWKHFYHLDVATLPPILDRIDALTVGSGQARDLSGEVAMFRGFCAIFTNQGARGLEYIEQALERISVTEVEARAQTEILFGIAGQMQGQRARVMRVLAGWLNDTAVITPLREAALLWTLTCMQYIAGDPEGARTHLQRMRQSAESHGVANFTAWCDYLEGLFFLQHGEPQLAIDLLESASERRYVHYTRAAVDALIVLTLAYQAHGQPERATATLRTLDEFARDLGPSFSVVAESCAVRLSLLQGRPESAVRWLEMSTPTPAEVMVLWFEIPCLTRCRALIAEGSAESLREAEKQLREYTERNEAHHNTCQLIGTLALQAMACDKQGKGDEARVLLARAIELARPGGYMFPFLELGAPMADLLDRLIKDNRGGDFARRLVARLGDPGSVLPILAPGVDETPGDSA